jgi:methanogenic corrinoid protein MtbC1
LGADAPTADIVQAVEDFQCDLLLLSASMSTQLKTVRDVITKVRQGTRVDCKVLIGGSAFDDCPEIWQQLGADGFATAATDALEQATRLLQS